MTSASNVADTGKSQKRQLSISKMMTEDVIKNLLDNDVEL